MVFNEPMEYNVWRKFEKIRMIKDYGRNIMNEPKITVENEAKEKIVVNQLKINQNTFTYDETVVPLSDISKISMASTPKEPYNLFHILLVVGGIALLFTKIMVWMLVGVGFMILGAFLLYMTHSKKQNTGEYLILNLKSGTDIYLYCRKHEFTVELMGVIMNCINSARGYNVNTENCQIESCKLGTEIN